MYLCITLGCVSCRACSGPSSGSGAGAHRSRVGSLWACPVAVLGLERARVGVGFRWGRDGSGFPGSSRCCVGSPFGRDRLPWVGVVERAEPGSGFVLVVGRPAGACFSPGPVYCGCVLPCPVVVSHRGVVPPGLPPLCARLPDGTRNGFCTVPFARRPTTFLAHTLLVRLSIHHMRVHYMRVLIVCHSPRACSVRVRVLVVCLFIA